MPNLNLSAIVMVPGSRSIAFSIALDSLRLLIYECRMISIVDINRQSIFNLTFIFDTLVFFSVNNVFPAFLIIFSFSSLGLWSSNMSRRRIYLVVILLAGALEFWFASEEVQAVFTTLENTRCVSHAHLLDVACVADRWSWTRVCSTVRRLLRPRLNFLDS